LVLATPNPYGFGVFVSPTSLDVAVAKTTFSRPVIGRAMALAAEEPAVRDETFHADGSARVELARTDPDLGTQAVAVAVGETQARVVEDVGRVDAREEVLGRRDVLGDD